MSKNVGNLERIMNKSCTKQGHLWVVEKGKNLPTCLRCGYTIPMPKAPKAEEKLHHHSQPAWCISPKTLWWSTK